MPTAGWRCHVLGSATLRPGCRHRPQPSQPSPDNVRSRRLGTARITCVRADSAPADSGQAPPSGLISDRFPANAKNSRSVISKSSRTAQGRPEVRLPHDGEAAALHRPVERLRDDPRADAPQPAVVPSPPPAGCRTTAASASTTASFCRGASGGRAWHRRCPGGSAPGQRQHVDALALRSSATICWPLASLTIDRPGQVAEGQVAAPVVERDAGRAAERARRQVLQRVGQQRVDPLRPVDAAGRVPAPDGHRPGSRTSAASPRASCSAAGPRHRGRRRAAENWNMYSQEAHARAGTAGSSRRWRGSCCARAGTPPPRTRPASSAGRRRGVPAARSCVRW